MATIRNRNGRWQAQVRKLGHKPITKTFDAKKDASAWAREIEHQLDKGQLATGHAQSRHQLSTLLQRYERSITPGKKSQHVERYRIAKLLRHSLARQFVERLTPQQIADYRDERLLDVSGETVRQDLVLIRQVIEVARREWGVVMSSNPVDGVRKPQPAVARQRRLSYGDLRAITAAFATLRNPLIKEVFRFALATGMRRGEILRVEWQHIDWDDHVLLIPETKNGRPRNIPLTRPAIATLTRLYQGVTTGLVFPITPNAFRLAWQRVKKKAGVADFRFHDLRHEAVSSFFEKGLSLPEVALISGHRDPRQLMRYTHLEARNIARKLSRSQSRTENDNVQ